MADSELFDAFVAARAPALVRLALLLTGDRGHAEDLVQTALAKAWLRWDRIGGVEHVEAYVRAMVVNTQRSWWRRRRPVEVLGADPPERPAEEATDGVLARDAVRRLVGQLPRQQRAVLVLRFYSDLSEAQTAAALGCSVGTVKSHTSRALATLRAEPGLRALLHDHATEEVTS